jgi:YopX protein.|nr:MAG TPA: YopX protein [Caudoviricetes sp.]
MNREIKFRAKALSTNKLIFGDLHLLANFPHIHDALGKKHLINSDTICQFTGLYAKSGKEIYEGDILKITEGSVICICVVTWNEEIGAWSLKLRGHTETGERPLGKWLCDNDYDIKVAGNIFDNKEILEYE